jgi:hypothetical protein
MLKLQEPVHKSSSIMSDTELPQLSAMRKKAVLLLLSWLEGPEKVMIPLLL